MTVDGRGAESDERQSTEVTRNILGGNFPDQRHSIVCEPGRARGLPATFQAGLVFLFLRAAGTSNRIDQTTHQRGREEREVASVH